MTRFQRAALVGATAMALAALVDLFMRGSWLRVMLGMGLAVGVLMLPRLQSRINVSCPRPPSIVSLPKLK